MKALHGPPHSLGHRALRSWGALAFFAAFLTFFTLTDNPAFSLPPTGGKAGIAWFVLGIAGLINAAGLVLRPAVEVTPHQVVLRSGWLLNVVYERDVVTDLRLAQLETGVVVRIHTPRRVLTQRIRLPRGVKWPEAEREIRAVLSLDLGK